jgi:hypothetical protein
MNKPNFHRIAARRFTGWLVLCAFLALGFCPLRNTLLNLAHPAAAAPKVPEYSKITGQDDCVAAVIQKAVMTTGKSPVPPFNLTDLPIHTFAAYIAGFTIQAKDCLHINKAIPSSLPIYLFNHSLLI